MNRLESVIKSDVQSVSEQMLNLLENEIEYAVKNFVSLSGKVKVRYVKNGENLKFMVEFEAERVRPLGFIPRR